MTNGGIWEWRGVVVPRGPAVGAWVAAQGDSKRATVGWFSGPCPMNLTKAIKSLTRFASCEPV